MRARLALWFVAAVLAAACASGPVHRHAWLEPITAAAPLPEKAAVFTDAAFLHRAADSRRYLSVAESIEMAGALDDEAESLITGAKWTVVSKRKFFIGAYLNRPQLIAPSVGGELAARTLPIHLDPTVCRNEKTTTAMIELWRAARVAVGDPSAGLPVEAARAVGARYQADTLVFVFGVSRKEDNAAGPTGEVYAALEAWNASVVAVAMVRAADGKVVYRAATPIAGPQRELAQRGALRSILNALPKRAPNSLSYPTPTLAGTPKTDDAAAAGRETSPWLDPGAAGATAEPATPTVDPNAGRPGRLVGSQPINLLRRPMAIADPVVTASPGTSVRVLQTDLNWALVQLPNGAKGWVFRKWVELE